MPKDRRVNSSSFDWAMVSPYSCSSKITHSTNHETFLPHIGNEREWEEARCPICMEHPHNAVLLLCSSHEKGCRPFICDTSYRHSNCLDQFVKNSASSAFSPQEKQSQLVCPLCRGEITGWDVIHLARKFMNSKTRNCSLETCGFSGNYSGLRKHARIEHPFERPSEASPTRLSNWTVLEQQTEIDDALAHQSDIEYDLNGWLSWDEWGDNGLWSDGSFFDFPSGMSDIEDELIDEMFSGISLSFMSLYPSFTEDELMDSGSSRSATSGSRWTNQLENDLRSISRSSYRSGNEATSVRSRSSYPRENGTTNTRSRSSYHRENDSPVSSPRSSRHGENVPRSLRTRSNYHEEDGSLSRSRSSYLRENASASLRAWGESTQPSSRARSRYDRMEVGPSVRRSNASSRHIPGSSRQPRPDLGRRAE
ncbi:hypothetical protein OROHE_005817 [Orobanche hederae]